MKPHTAKDKEVSMEEVTALETQLYYHTTAILRSFGVGRQHEEEHDRIVQAMKPGANGVAAIGGQPKDHKERWTALEGPPVRPVVNGNVGANAPAGKITARLLRPLRMDTNREQKTSICSTEELLVSIERE